MSQQIIDILLIEDDQTFAKIVSDVLALSTSSGSKFIVHISSNLSSAIVQIPKLSPTLILLDLGLPDSEGEETFSGVHRVASHLPIVLLTSNEDENLALSLVQKGAQDYLVKSRTNLALLPRIIQYAIERKRDFEELKKAHEQLRAMQAQLIQAEKMDSLGKLAVGIAHEVKNPIAIVQQCIDFLSHSEITKESNVQAVLNDMTESIERAERIIHELLNLASPPDVNSHMSFESLNTILDSTLEIVRHEIKKSQITVTKQFEPRLVPILIHRNSVEQACLNLLLNAMQSMPQGGELVIKTYLNKQDEITSFQVIEIRDCGIGIPADILPKIFEPFFTTKKDHGGTGLGLSVVRNVMELHKGSVELKNNRNERGTTATLMFRVPTF